ncbi:hypothetical protein [Peribacillus simplex]
MKKRMAIAILSFLILSGCSLLGEVHSSLEYEDNVSGYINTVKEKNCNC